MVAQIGCITGLVVWSLVLLIRNIRRGLVRWRPAMIMGSVAAALMILSQLLSRDQMLKNYPTAVPIETFQVMQYVLLATGMIFGSILLAAAAALVTSTFPECLAAWRASNRRIMGADAAAAVVAAIGFGILINRIAGFLTGPLSRAGAVFLRQSGFDCVGVSGLGGFGGEFPWGIIFLRRRGRIGVAGTQAEAMDRSAGAGGSSCDGPGRSANGAGVRAALRHRALHRESGGAVVLAIRAEQLPGLRAGVLGYGAARKHLEPAGDGDSGDADTRMDSGGGGRGGSDLGSAAGLHETNVSGCQSWLQPPFRRFSLVHASTYFVTHQASDFQSRSGWFISRA
jgi:hypothetical protein